MQQTLLAECDAGIIPTPPRLLDLHFLQQAELSPLPLSSDIKLEDEAAYSNTLSPPMTPNPAIRRYRSLLKSAIHVILLAVLLLCTGFSGLAMSRINECESTPAESELVEFKILVTHRGCRRRAGHQSPRLPSGIVSAILSAHCSEPAVYLSATARTEHAFRNGGIGSPLRC